MQTKATKDEVRELNDVKTNKQETTVTNENVKMLHKMLTNISVLVIEALKGSLNTNETDVKKQ